VSANFYHRLSLHKSNDDDLIYWDPEVIDTEGNQSALSRVNWAGRKEESNENPRKLKSEIVIPDGSAYNKRRRNE
jgi:hypothetical protein